LVAAGVSSQFPNVALLPWLLDDYHERETNMKRKDYRMYALGISLLGLIVPIFHAKPIVIMIASQAFGALLLPITVSCILILGNKPNLMKTNKFSTFINIILVAILIFSLVMSYMSITGIVNVIQSI